MFLKMIMSANDCRVCCICGTSSKYFKGVVFSITINAKSEKEMHIFKMYICSLFNKLTAPFSDFFFLFF